MNRKLLFFSFCLMFLSMNITFVSAQQEDETVVLTVSPDTVRLGNRNAEATITIKCNSHFVWDVISPVEFFNAERVNNAIVVFSSQKSGIKTERAGKIRIKAGNIVKDVVVIQEPSQSWFRIKGDFSKMAIPVGGSLGYASKYYYNKVDNVRFVPVGEENMVSGLRVGLFSTDVYFVPRICGIGIHTGVFYQFYYQESEPFKNEKNEDVRTIFQEHVLTVPVYLNYRIDFDEKGIFGMYIRGGLNLDFPVVSLLYDSDTNGKFRDHTLLKTGSQYFKDANCFNLAIGYAAGIRIHRVMLEYSGYRGVLNDVRKHSDINFTVRIMMKDTKK